MKPFAILAIVLISSLTADEPSPHLLRLSDGELEGQFGGLSEEGFITWHRNDTTQPLEFKTKNIKQISFPHSNVPPANNNTSHVTLVNDDRIPGQIIAIDESSITLETTMCGTLMIPRENFTTIKPNPFGGRLIYVGPHNKKGWESISPGDDDESEKDEDNPDEHWHQRGSYWYSIQGDDVLALKDINMPAQSVFKFKAEWRNRPSIEIAFQANFQHPPEDQADNEAAKVEENRRGRRRVRNHSSFATRYGDAYVMTFRSHYVSLHHCGYNDEEEPFSHQIKGSTNRVNIDNETTANFELRTDTNSGMISLYIDGRFAVQWRLHEHLKENQSAPASNGQIAFYSNRSSSQPLKISEVLVAEWNGVPDSARSLENDEFDVILLTNGTDRFAGHVKSLKQGKLVLEGHYATLDIPLEEIAEIQFAKDARAEHSAKDNITVYYQPYGRISGNPIQSSQTTMKLRSPLLGEIKLDLTSASLIDFHSNNSFLNFWEEDL